VVIGSLQILKPKLCQRLRQGRRSVRESPQATARIVIALPSAAQNIEWCRRVRTDTAAEAAIRHIWTGPASSRHAPGSGYRLVRHHTGRRGSGSPVPALDRWRHGWRSRRGKSPARMSSTFVFTTRLQSAPAADRRCRRFGGERWRIAAGCLNHRRGQIPRAARTTDGSWCSRVIRRISADVDEARLGLCLGWRLRLCRKLKHRRLLTLV
jgi:hypothetical protein